MIEIIQKSMCVGCYACCSCCPQQCISMEEDGEGFKYPSVNKSKCINCNKCEAVCPVIHSAPTQDFSEISFAAYSKDEVIRSQSSSGGVFSVLAEAVINQGGVVFGAAFDREFQVHHIGITSTDDLKFLRGSKYIQSRIEDTYKEIKEILKTDRKVYFSGTPCQVDGLKNFLGKEYDNLLTQDIICHGVSSPVVWEKYLNYVKDKIHSDIKHITFRDKTFGWNKYAVKIEGKNGTEEKSTFLENEMMKAYLRNVCLRPSCYNCPSKGLKRSSDITLADFWAVNDYIKGFDDNKGIDLVVCHSEKGAKFWKEVVPLLVCCEVDIQAASGNFSMNCSSRLPKYRDDFMHSLENHTFADAVKRYCSIPLSERIYTKIKLGIKKVSRRK